MCRQTYLIDGFVEGRLLQRWRTTKSRHSLPYVSINDELRQQTSWPPPSQLGGSLVDIMRLENSFFQAEQAHEALLPKAASGDSIGNHAVPWPQPELVATNDITVKNQSCFSTADNSSSPVILDTFAPVMCGIPRPYDGTVL